MPLQIGIVGLPNVGKSTLFTALTKKQVPAENYPFCTIDPNVGVVAVPDERLDKLAGISKSEKIIPTSIEFVDIAGLVKDAHKGEGLGNQFLSHIREVDAIAHVVREFTDTNVVHVENSVNPIRDRDIINLELIMADLATVEKRIKTAQATARTGEKESKVIVSALEKIKLALDQGKLAHTVNLSEQEDLIVKQLSLLTRKPMLYVVNADEHEKDKESKQHLSTEAHENKIVLAVKYESEIATLTKEELGELGIEETGLEKLIKASYELLDLITYFTSGPKESRAWTVRRGSLAPQAAGVIHTDFEKGFIRAEVISYQDFVTCNGEHGAKEKGLMRLEGKEYAVQDGDVMHFRFAT